jgi:hypothetical protein
MSTSVRITAHDTPHHTDPADAGEFYGALGMLSVAWGRLEGHLTGNLLTMMNLLTLPLERLPSRWDERLNMWAEGFSLPVLQTHKDRAIVFLHSVIGAATDRNFAAHAIWDSFVSNGIGEPAMTARAIKARKGHRNTVEVDDRLITLSMIKKALDECNRLNQEMAEFTNLIGSVAPPPGGAIRL